MVDLFGDVDSLHRCMDVDEPATLQELRPARSQDDEFRKLVIRGGDVWIDGNGRDTPMATIQPPAPRGVPRHIRLVLRSLTISARSGSFWSWSVTF
jgi:hypothetical protein